MGTFAIDACLLGSPGKRSLPASINIRVLFLGSLLQTGPFLIHTALGSHIDVHGLCDNTLRTSPGVCLLFLFKSHFKVIKIRYLCS